MSFRSVQLSSNKSSAQSRSLDIQFSSSRVPKAVLSTVNSIQVECPSRRSLDSRFNSGRVSKSPFSRQSIQFKSSVQVAVLSTVQNSAAVSPSFQYRSRRVPSRCSPDKSKFSSRVVAVHVGILKDNEGREIDLGSLRRILARQTIQCRRLSVFTIWTFKIPSYRSSRS